MSLEELGKSLAKKGYESTVKNSEVGFLSTGYPALDYAVAGSYTNGGLPIGRITEMFGPPSSGKTAIATFLMKNAQQRGGIAIFMDHEESFDMELAESFGLNTSFPRFIYKQPNTYEDSVDMASDIIEVIRERNGIPAEAPIVVVFDSLASMIPKSQWEKNGSNEYNMNDNTALSRATSANFKVIAKKAKQHNVLFLFLNQSRTKIGVLYGDPTSTPGGSSPEFYSSVRIKLGRTMIKEGKNTVGQKIGAECVKNKVTRPFRKASWNFMFLENGHGEFDIISSMIDYMTEKGIIETRGPRIVWEGSNRFKKEVVIDLKKDSEASIQKLAQMCENSKGQQVEED